LVDVEENCKRGPLMVVALFIAKLAKNNSEKKIKVLLCMNRPTIRLKSFFSITA
jgi:hypothetical protein